MNIGGRSVHFSQPFKNTLNHRTKSFLNSYTLDRFPFSKNLLNKCIIISFILVSTNHILHKTSLNVTQGSIPNEFQSIKTQPWALVWCQILSSWWVQTYKLQQSLTKCSQFSYHWSLNWNTFLLCVEQKFWNFFWFIVTGFSRYKQATVNIT